jgi:hypothetical protein
MAILQIRGVYTGRSANVNLNYYYFSSNTWWCLPGYLGPIKGTWFSSGMSNSIFLYDPDDQLIASSYDMDVQYLGYPFDGLAGKTGPFSVYAKNSVFYNDTTRWKFLSV